MIDDVKRLSKPLLFLYGGTIVTRIGAFVFPYLTIYLTESRGFGFDQVGLILSIGSLGLLLGNLAGGWLADSWSRKRTLLCALLINALGFAGLGFVHTGIWQYAALLFVGYFGSGMYSPAANALIAELSEDSIRSFAYTVNYVCINMGMALGPLLGGVLASIAYHWIFVGDVVSSLLCAMLIAIGVPASTKISFAQKPVDANRERKAATSTEGTTWLRYPLVLAFCFSYFFLVCPLMGLEYAVPILVKQTFSSSLTYVGIIYTFNAVCILGLSFFVEKQIRNRNAIQSMIVAGAFWSCGLAVLLIGFSLPSLLICTLIWTIGEMIASIVVPTFVAERVSPRVKGRFLALNDMVRSLSGIVCPLGLGLIWTHFGARSAVAVLAALPIIAIAAYAIIFAVDARDSLSRAMPNPATEHPMAGESLT